VGKFIASRGPGLHHLAYEVDDVASALTELTAAGAELIDLTPREGLFGLQVAFVAPGICQRCSLGGGGACLTTIGFESRSGSRAGR